MIGRLFRLPPIVYFILAPIFAALGVALFISSNNDDAERAAALSHAAPDPVELQDVASADTGSDFNEIVLMAQADFDNEMILERKKRGRVRSTDSFIPLYPTDATDFSGPVVAVMEVDGVASDEAIAAMLEGDGPAGPVLRINGVFKGGADRNVSEAFEGRKTLAQTMYTVKPFLEGREAGLEVKEAGTPLLIIGFILALIVGGYGYFRKTRLDKKREEEAAEAQAAAPAEA